uniref:Uncharacterized protein n=1 Tax=Anguilla anguilla TaxID=7936 RepID=A0A0E9TVQ6_ANGAN
MNEMFLTENNNNKCDFIHRNSYTKRQNKCLIWNFKKPTVNVQNSCIILFFSYSIARIPQWKEVFQL